MAEQYREIKLPNKKIGRFPADMSDADIEAVLRKQFPPIPEETPESESFGQKVLRYGIKDPLVGFANLGHGILNAPHNLAALFSERLASHIPKQAEFDYGQALGLPKEGNLADTLIQFTPQAAEAFAIPATRIGSIAKGAGQIPKIGAALQRALTNKYVDKTIGNAISQGLLAASQSPENQGEAAATAAGISAPFSALSQGILSGSPSVRAASKALLGGLGAYTGYEGAKQLGLGEFPAEAVAALTGALGLSGFTPKKQAARQMLEGVEGTNYEDMLEAGKRLGLSYLSPGEASGSPFTGATQGNIGKSKEGAKLLYEAGQRRLGEEEKSIDKLLNTIFEKKEFEPKIDALYKKAEKEIVPEEALIKLRENEVIKSALKRVEKKPAYRQSLKGVPKNSIEYLDKVKEALDDMIKEAPSREGKIITDTKKELLEIIDKISPEYQKARQLAEQEITRRGLEKVFNKKEMTGSNFSKFLQDKKAFNDVMFHLRNVPEAQEQLKDMRMVFKNLINVPTAKTAEALSRSSMSKPRSLGQELLFKFQQLLSAGRFDKHAVELITNPKWADELKKLKNIGKTEKLVGHAVNLLGKAGAQIGAKKVAEPLELELTPGPGTKYED